MNVKLKLLFSQLTLTLILLTSINNSVNAQCPNSPDKILLIGDSWSFFMWTYNAFPTNLNKYAYPDYQIYSDTSLSIMGSDTWNFVQPTRRNIVLGALAAHPNAKLINLSIGGNDLLSRWKVSMTNAQTDSIINDMMIRLDTIVNYIKAARPGIKIYLTNYDYPNFGETVLTSFHPYYHVWTNMGSPNFTQINTALEKGALALQVFVATRTDVDATDARGLMQYIYGQSSPMLVSPYATYAANTAVVPGGYINYPSPLAAMGAGGTDSFHLSSNGFKQFIDYHFSHFYFNALNHLSDYTYVANPNKSGSVTSAQINNGLYLGNRNGDSSKVVLSFNTPDLASVNVINNAELLLKADSNFQNLFTTNTLKIELANSYFGSSDSIQLSDYADSTIAFATSPCTYGNLAAAGYWVRIIIPTSIAQYMNNSSQVQLRLSFTNLTTNTVMKFAIDTVSLPILKINKSTIIGIDELNIKPKMEEMTIIPNPANNYITCEIANTTITDITLYSITGKKVLQSKRQKIDVSKLPQGLYLVRASANNKIFTGKFIKR